ncbi:MAG: zinc-binding dehydrogenase [Treponema sp.]|jgi:L-iditol 2-dehydrogenase|nr:zinc-binding dehydrogenase [Treponema sp.]
MKALVKTQKGPGNLELLDVEEPRAVNDLVKIRVVYAGICGTDIHTWEGIYPGNTPPVTLGHEFSGIVEEVGDAVGRIRAGDRVTAETTYYSCMACDFCKNEEYNLCASRRGIGTQVNGAFARAVLVPERSVHRIPEGVSLKSAALSEPLACCVHGCMEKTTPHRGSTALVTGPGAIGLLSALVLLSEGLQVILAGTSADTDRLLLARELGVQTVDLQREDLAEVVAKMTNGAGASPVIECSGSIKALNSGLSLAAKKADIVQMGVFAREVNEVNVSFFFPRELRLVGSRTQKPSSWRKTMELMGNGSIVPEKLVSFVYPLEDWLQGFTDVREKRGIKVLLRAGGE